MRLVFIIDSPHSIGGGDYAQFIFAKRLAEKGHEVAVFGRDKNFLSPELEGVENLRVRYSRSIPQFAKKVGIGLLNHAWGWLYNCLVVRPYVRRHKPDWVIGYLREAAIKAACVGRRTGTKVANFVFETPPWMAREVPEEWAEELRNDRFRRSWERTKKAYAESDVLIPNSLRSGVMCREWLAQARVSEPVYPGIDEDGIPRTRRKRIYDFVYVGRLNALKNVDEFLLAASMLRREVTVLIIGSGEELPRLKRLAEQHSLDVVFKGAVADDEKWSFLQQSKVLVFPTSHEGFGMPPLEAIACGCEVICSSLPIFDEVYGKAVHYFPLHDVEALARLMKEVLSGRKKMPALAKRLPKRFSWDNSVLTIERILKKRRKGVGK